MLKVDTSDYTLEDIALLGGALHGALVDHTVCTPDDCNACKYLKVCREISSLMVQLEAEAEHRKL